MIIAQLTLQFSRNKNYNNMKELDGLIYTHEQFKDFTDRYSETLKKGIEPRLGLNPLRLSEMT